MSSSFCKFGSMNRRAYFITLLLLLVSLFCFSQNAYLFVKKGFKKKKTYIEGDPIAIRLRDGSYIAGTVTLLRNDTIFINDFPVRCPDVREVVLSKKPKLPFPDAKTLLVIGGGSALVTAGLTISKQATFKEALIAGLTIGYAPLLIKYLGVKFYRLITRKEFRMGKKFHLQVLDFHLTPTRIKPF
ncbi:MAG: hypothetical protein Q8941_16505 [Bacteroidota bacterium]|nr:hypothetical protein [Bacteroidota bacterium]